MVVSQEPKLLEISTDPAANFMLSLQIEGVDLNGPEQYFNITMKKVSFVYDNVTKSYN